MILVATGYICIRKKFYSDIHNIITQKYKKIYYRSLLQGKTSHKFIDMSENPIMRLYYTNRKVLFFMCAGNEAFYAALYLLFFTEGPTCKFYIYFVLYINNARYYIKYCKIYIFISVVGISLFRLVMYLSAPIAFIKAAISLLHGYISCINLSIIDLKERQEHSKLN